MYCDSSSMHNQWEEFLFVESKTEAKNMEHKIALVSLRSMYVETF